MIEATPLGGAIRKEAVLMNNRRSSSFIILGVISFLIVIVFGLLLAAHVISQNQGANTTVVWQITTSSLTQKDKQSLETAWKTKLLALGTGPTSVAGHTFTIEEAHRQDNWIYISGKDSSKKPFPTPLSFIAHYQDGTWVV